MKKILIIPLLCLICNFVFAQGYNPNRHIVVNDAIFPALKVPLNGRTMYFDSTLFIYRDFQNPTEVLINFSTQASRFGAALICVHQGGTLTGGGSYVGGVRNLYWFRNGLADSNLVRFPTDTSVASAAFLIANNLSEGVPSTIKTNLSLQNVDNTSDATKNSASVSLTNHTIDANNNTLLHIPNSALTNSSIGLSITNNPASDITVTTTPAALGASLIANIPNSTPSQRGALQATDFAKFNSKIDSTTMNSGDSVFDWRNGTQIFRYVAPGPTNNADSIRHRFVDTSTNRNNYVLSWDSVNKKFFLAAPPGTAGISSLNGLTVATQIFANGFSGTAPNIVSSGSTHTFNIPILSNADTGVATPTQKTFWDAKQPQLNGTGFVKASGTTISYDNKAYIFDAGNGVTDSAGKILWGGPLYKTVLIDGGNQQLNIDSVGYFELVTKINPPNYSTFTFQPNQSILRTLGGNNTTVSEIGTFVTNPFGDGTTNGINLRADNGSIATRLNLSERYIHFVTDSVQLTGWGGGTHVGLKTHSLAEDANGNIIEDTSATSGGTQDLESVLAHGGTLLNNHTITNTGHTLSFTGGVYKINGLASDTANVSYILAKKNDSSVSELTMKQLANLLPFDSTKVNNLLSVSTDSILQVGGVSVLSNTKLGFHNRDSLTLDSLTNFFIKNLGLATSSAGMYVMVRDSVTGKIWNIQSQRIDTAGFFNGGYVVYGDTATGTFKMEAIPLGVWIHNPSDSRQTILTTNTDTVVIGAVTNPLGKLNVVGTFQRDGAMMGTNTIVATKDTTQLYSTNVTFQATANVKQQEAVTLTQASSSDTTFFTWKDLNLIDANASKHATVTGMSFTYRKNVGGGSNQDFTGFNVGVQPATGDSIRTSVFYAANLFNPPGFDSTITVVNAPGSGTFNHVGKITGLYFGSFVTNDGSIGVNLNQNAGTGNYNVYAAGTANNFFNGPLILNNVLSGGSSAKIFVHDTDSTIKQLTLGTNLSISGGALNATGGGGGGIGTDSTITITSGGSSTVTDDYNQVIIDPTGGPFTNYTLTLPTNWHTSKNLIIYFGGTNITSGSVITGTLTIIAGSGQTIVQALTPGAFNYGEQLTYHLVGTQDRRINY